MESPNFAKWFVYAGIGLIVIGLLFWLGSRMGISFGKLPGDIHVQKERFSFYFPIATSIFVSILLTLIINLIFWFLKK